MDNASVAHVVLTRVRLCMHQLVSHQCKIASYIPAMKKPGYEVMWRTTSLQRPFLGHNCDMWQLHATSGQKFYFDLNFEQQSCQSRHDVHVHVNASKLLRNCLFAKHFRTGFEQVSNCFSFLLVWTGVYTHAIVSWLSSYHFQHMLEYWQWLLVISSPCQNAKCLLKGRP